MGIFKSGPPKVAATTEEEKKAVVAQLQDRFADSDLDEVTISRFALCRSWDLEGATRMLQKHIDWRRANLPVTLEEVKPVFDQGKFRLLGKGAEGRPVMMISLLPLLGVDFQAEGEMRRHVRAAVYCAERMIASMGPGVAAWTSVIDCTGIRAPPQAFLQEFTKVMQPNYPERAARIVMYPVPSFVVKVAKTFMGILPEKTRGKVSFCSDASELCREVGIEMSALSGSTMENADSLSLAPASQNMTLLRSVRGPSHGRDEKDEKTCGRRPSQGKDERKGGHAKCRLCCTIISL